MIDHALNVLTLYVLWKARGLTHATEPSPEEALLREKLTECRASLLEKLFEFAVGTQSNTADGVKRAVRFMSVELVYMYSLSFEGFPKPHESAYPIRTPTS